MTPEVAAKGEGVGQGEEYAAREQVGGEEAGVGHDVVGGSLVLDTTQDKTQSCGSRDREALPTNGSNPIKNGLLF